MRILLVSPGLPPDKTGGIENYVQMVRQELIRLGHSVTVLTQLHKRKLNDPGVIQIGVREGELRGYAFWAANAWLKEISSEYEVTHFNGFPGQILSLAPLARPKVVHVHNSLSMEPDWWAKGGIRHDLGFFVASQAFRRATVVVCPTEVVKDDILRYSKVDKRKTRVIPNCVDTEFYKRNGITGEVRERYGLRNRFVILYFGKIKRTKGIEVLCKAYQLVKKEIDAALIVGGSVPATDTFLQYLKRTYPDVIFTGYVNDPRPYYAAADVFSILTPGFYGGEVFAIALGEAMSMGLPVVCSENPIFREVTKGNALFATPNDPASVAEKLLQLARSDRLASAMGTANRTLAERFYNVKEVVRQLGDAYADACA